MNDILHIAYELVASGATLASRVVPGHASSKLARAFVARRGVVDRFIRWGTTARDARRPLLWMHAPSVGEGLMALPIVQRVRTEIPDAQIAYTFFSPSAERFAAKIGADFADYLPFDTTSSMTRIVAALQPTALVFSKLDVWPTLVDRAHTAGVKTGLVSASMPAQSKRHGIGAMITRGAYDTLDLVGASSEDDARRLVDAGVHADRVRVTGDTRYDQAWARAHTPSDNTTTVESLRSTRPTLVAGSTWSADEAQLLPAWEAVVRHVPTARLIVAPHEIEETHLRALEAWARRSNLRAARLGNLRDIASLSSDAIDVLIIDRIGILADLYALATVAYVGGGFHAAGLHSVVEPAVFHAPTIIGPRHDASRDAVSMRAARGIRVVADAAQMEAALRALLTETTDRERMSHALARVVSGELGAVDRSLEIVRVLLGRV